MKASVTNKKFSGPEFKHGKDIFKDQLARVPKSLSADDIIKQFELLQIHITQNADALASKTVMQRAEILAEPFPVCAYGYPKTYILFLAG